MYVSMYVLISVSNVYGFDQMFSWNGFLLVYEWFLVSMLELIGIVYEMNRNIVLLVFSIENVLLYSVMMIVSIVQVQIVGLGVWCVGFMLCSSFDVGSLLLWVNVYIICDVDMIVVSLYM